MRSRAPIGTRPRPEYDPTTQTLLARKQAKAVELAAVGTPLSARQIDRYLRRWRAQGKAGLIDPRRLPLPQSRTPSELITLVDDALAAQKNRSSGTRRRVLLQVSVEAAELGVEVPSQATMYRLMDRLDRQRHSFGDAPTRRSLASRPDRTFGRQTPLRPGELTEIDGTSFDVLVVYPDGSTGRVELVAMIDVATHLVCGAVLRPVAAKSVDAAVVLARALTPQQVQPGWLDELALSQATTPVGMIPDTDTVLHDVATRPAIMVETVTTDRGKVYLSQTFLEACERLEISVIEAAPRTGSDKPHIERLFGSINTQFAEYLAGYAGRSVARRGVDVEAEAVWTLAQLQNLLEVWLVQVWHNRPQKSLRHPSIPKRQLSPNEMYRILSAVSPSVPVVLDRSDYISLLRRDWRRIQAYGINFGDLIYDSRELRRLRTQTSGSRLPGAKGRWEIRYDPYRLNSIFVRDDVNDTWVEAPWTLAHLTAGPFSREILAEAKKVIRHPPPGTPATDLVTEIRRLQTTVLAPADRSRRRARQRAAADPIVPDDPTAGAGAGDLSDPVSGGRPDLTLVSQRTYRPIHRILYDSPDPPVKD